MKNIFLIIVLAIAFALPCFAANSLNDAKRDLKLAITYREAADYDNAIKYIKKGQDILARYKNWEGRYWLAVSEEYYGYVCRDMNREDEAKDHFTKAIASYRKLIKQNDGSQVPLEIIKDKIKTLANGKTAKYSSNSKTVNFDNSKLKALPADIPDNVENLSAVNNKIKEFPIGLASYKSLKYLDLSDNKIKNISDVYMPRIEYLNLSGNKIKTIPAQIADLKNLSILDLSNNSLKAIPASLCNLKNLKVLNLRGNKIQFENIKNLIQCLPATNILHDKYVREENDDDIEVVPGGETE